MWTTTLPSYRTAVLGSLLAVTLGLVLSLILGQPRARQDAGPTLELEAVYAAHAAAGERLAAALERLEASASATAALEAAALEAAAVVADRLDPAHTGDAAVCVARPGLFAILAPVPTCVALVVALEPGEYGTCALVAWPYGVCTRLPRSGLPWGAGDPPEQTYWVLEWIDPIPDRPLTTE